MKKLKLMWVVLTFIVLISFIPFAQSQPANSPWPMAGHDMRNTNRSPYIGPEDNTIKWTREPFGLGAAIGNDHTLYFGFCSLRSDGSLNWTYTTENIITFPALDEDGTIYFGSWDDNFYALNSDGTLKWVFSTGGLIEAPPTIDYDGTIYFGSTDNNFYALNPDGTLKWSFRSEGFISESSAIAEDGTIYFSSWSFSEGRNKRTGLPNFSGKFYALNPDGSLKWSRPMENRISSSPVIGSDGTIYFGTWNGRLYALNPDNTLDWTFKTLGVTGAPALAKNGTLYVVFHPLVSDNDALYALYALNSDNGTLKWTHYPVTTGTVVDAEGNTYVGIGGGNPALYSLNSDGSVRWRFRTEDAPAPPTIDSDGTLYFGDVNGNFYAIGSPSEEHLSTWLVAVFLVIPLLTIIGAFLYYRRK